MSDFVLARAVHKFALLAVILIAGASPARADIVYDYDEGWLFDSNTGLYWQLLQVPSATFIPSAGAIADAGMLSQLEGDAGITSGTPGSPNVAPYSSPVADFVSFFASGTPAIPGAPVEAFALYQYPPDLPLGGFQYLLFNYQPITNSTAWEYYTVTTIGTYRPGRPLCPNDVCQPTQPAFVYSDIRPTPLPESSWLLFSGLTWLAARKIRLTRRAA